MISWMPDYLFEDVMLHRDDGVIISLPLKRMPRITHVASRERRYHYHQVATCLV